MNAVEIIVSAIIIVAITFLISNVTSFIFAGIPNILLVTISVCIALKILVFVIGRRD